MVINYFRQLKGMNIEFNLHEISYIITLFKFNELMGLGKIISTGNQVK